MGNISAKKNTREKGNPQETSNDTPNKETKEAFQELQRLKNDPKKKTYGSFAELLVGLVPSVRYAYAPVREAE